MYDDHRSGWAEFAAVVMFAVGGFRVISAIAYFADSRKIENLTSALFSSHTWAWGIWDLLIAVAAVLAGLTILAGRRIGRVVAYIWAVLVLVQGFLTIGVAPWYSVAGITLGTLVIYGLASAAVTSSSGAAE